MNFEYKITTDEFATAQALYHRLSGGRRRVQSATCWILAGSFFVVVAWNQRPIDWAQVLLAALGAWWIYAGIMGLLLPIRHFRRYYASELARKTFRAEMNEDGFDVAGDICSWRAGWQGVAVEGRKQARLYVLFTRHCLRFREAILDQRTAGGVAQP